MTNADFERWLHAYGQAWEGRNPAAAGPSAGGSSASSKSVPAKALPGSMSAKNALSGCSSPQRVRT